MSEILKNKVAFVTGGAQGLGEAICHRLASEGADVVVADLNMAGAEKVAGEVAAKTGRKTLAVCVDVTKEDQVQAAIERCVQAFGRLDVVVSNAGILISGAVGEISSAKWHAVIEVNLFGYFLVARHAALQMMKQRSGVIIQVNSKSGKKGSFKNSAYAASKFGGNGLTQSLALELAEYGVRVNAVCPGNLLDSPLWVDSLYDQYARNQGMTKEQIRQKYVDQVPLGRGCTYDDVNNVIVFLASDSASYMTGQAINVTGGQEMR
jgi:sorbitol-6-phosphate 2-dehydrogenase